MKAKLVGPTEDVLAVFYTLCEAFKETSHDMDSPCAVWFYQPLRNGKTLRVGVIDDDCSEDGTFGVDFEVIETPDWLKKRPTRKLYENKSEQPDRSA